MITLNIFLASVLALGTDGFAANTGTAAADFELTGHDGKTYKLSAYKGKTVVLEWTNRGCPFVKKHYGTGNMQKLQDEYTKKKVAWFTIVSSAPGKQGHFKDGKEALGWRDELKAHQTAILFDPEGKVGKQYSAKTTPHMYVIDPKGNIAYQGAIDDKPSTDDEDVSVAKNYVKEALDAVIAGKAPKLATTQPYGCSVKYE